MSLVNSSIDINCDLGEIDPGLALERAIMPLINRCNIAAGAHAGNRHTIKESILLAAEHKLKIGVHPSFPDKANFGRVRMDMSNEKLLDSIKSQIISFLEIASKLQIKVDHIKAHGALYHYTAQDPEMADAYLSLIQDIDRNLKVMIPPWSFIEKEAESRSMPMLIEAFADRKYDGDGSLQSRSIEGSVIDDPAVVVAQVQSILAGKIVAFDGQVIKLSADTICVHSDTKNAIEILKAINKHF